MTTRSFGFRPNGSPQFLQDHLQKIGTAIFTEEQVGPSIKIPAGMLGKNGAIRFKLRSFATNDAVVKTVRVRAGNLPDVLSGTLVGTLTLTSVAGGYLELTISNRDNLAVNLVSADVGVNPVIPVVSALDTAKDLYLIMSTQKASGLAGSVSVESYIVELLAEPTVVTFQ
jgi:hypothetical protein